MLWQLNSALERCSKLTLTLLALGITLFLGGLDLHTGVESQLLLLYLAPIFLAAWYVSREVGIYLAFVASMVWFMADALGGRAYSSHWIVFWNMLMRTGIYVLFAVIQSKLRAKLDATSQLAARDFLTGLPNSHAFFKLTAQEMDKAAGQQPMTLAYVDVMGLQAVNDRFGYPAGDQTLCTVAHTIRQHVSRADLVGRISGTSFAVLLPKMASDSAAPVLQKLRDALYEERRRYSQPLTFYISAVACAKAPSKIAQIMHEAESQMIRMKGERQDSIQIAEVDEPAPLN